MSLPARNNVNPYLTEKGDTTEVHLPWPPSVNNYWKRGKFGNVYVASAGKEYRAAVLRRMKTLTRRFRGSVALLIKCHPPTRRKYDLDNLNKAMLDSLTAAGLWGDDSQVADLHLVKAPPERGGRVEVFATDMRDQLPF